jgi:hypothetical protein
MIGPRHLVIQSLKDTGKSMGLHWSSQCASGAVQPREARPGRSTRLSLATNRTLNWLWSVFFFSPLTSYMYYLQKLAPSII